MCSSSAGLVMRRHPLSFEQVMTMKINGSSALGFEANCIPALALANCHRSRATILHSQTNFITFTLVADTQPFVFHTDSHNHRELLQRQQFVLVHLSQGVVKV